MKEELINKILGRVKELNVEREELADLNKIVLERLCLIDDTNDLENVLEVILDNNFNTSVSILYINVYCLKNKFSDFDGNLYIDKIVYSEIGSKLKEEALRKVALANYDFQAKFIYYVYNNEAINHKDLIADIILECSKEFQVEAIYSIFSNIKTECIAEYLELAKIIAKEKDEYKVKIYTNLDWNLNILDLGLLLPVAKLISKCKCEAQAKNMYHYLDKLDSKNAPYVLKHSVYFLRTTDKDKLKALSKYLIYSLKQNLLLDEEKVNLIINARNKFNSDAIGNTLTYGPLIDANLDVVASEILNDSRKEYNAKYAKSLVNIGSVNGLSGAMIVNESETKYKAEQVHSIISLYANTDEIDESLEFAALINSVHIKTEIDLIYLLGQNGYLNKLGIALPIARVIANATDCEEEVIKIWECLKEEENKVNAIKGFVSLLQNINSKNRKKAEKIINLVLLKAQNNPIHLDVVESVVLANEKLKNKVKKLVNKKIKK